MTDYLVYSTVTSGKYGNLKVSDTDVGNLKIKGNIDAPQILKNGGVNHGIVYKAEAGAGGLNGTGGTQGVATASSQFNADYGPTKAFDGSFGKIGSFDNTWITETTTIPSASNPGILTFQFNTASGGPKSISMYKIWTRVVNVDGDRNPINWKFQGSNVSSPSAADGADWDDLDVRASVTTGWYDGVGRAFYNNTKIGTYEHYRLYVTQVQGNAFVQIGELGLYSCVGSGNSGFVENGVDLNKYCFNGGYLGINTNTPSVPLDVSLGRYRAWWTFDSANYVLYANGSGAVQNQHPGLVAWDPSYEIAAVFETSVFCQSSIIATTISSFSDTRIKKDIVDVTDTEALDKLRLIKPKKYKYVDTVVRGESEVYGFIAQEVATVIPTAVSITKETVPDIYKIGAVSSDKQTITMPDDTTISQGDTLKLLDLSDQTLFVKVTEVESPRIFKIDTKLDSYSLVNGDNCQIFVYGRQVTDFNNLNKESIWTVATAAIQELDRQLQTRKTKVTTLQTEIDALKAHLNL